MREGSGQGGFAAYQLDPEGLLAMVGMPNGENEKRTCGLEQSVYTRPFVASIATTRGLVK
jgi:hypothetical protein